MAGYPGNHIEDKNSEKRFDLYLNSEDNEALNLLKLDIKKVLSDLESDRDIDKAIKCMKIMVSEVFFSINDIDEFEW